MAIREPLAKADPHNADWQRDLSFSYERIGDVEEALGNISTALSFYEKSLPITQVLAQNSPDHPQFQSDISITMRRLTQLRGSLSKVALRQDKR